METVFTRSMRAHRTALDQVEALEGPLNALGQVVFRQINSGHKLLLVGNGGSAGDAQHIASEFTGRFLRERRGLPALALTTDCSALTSIANDYGFDQVFARQIQALAQSGDVLLAISTSGNSPNILNALHAGVQAGCICWGFSGRDGGAMAPLLGERNLVVQAPETATIQECHILMGHILCALVDEHCAASQSL